MPYVVGEAHTTPRDRGEAWQSAWVSGTVEPIGWRTRRGVRLVGQLFSSPQSPSNLALTRSALAQCPKGTLGRPLVCALLGMEAGSPDGGAAGLSALRQRRCSRTRSGCGGTSCWLSRPTAQGEPRAQHAQPVRPRSTAWDLPRIGAPEPSLPSGHDAPRRS